MRDCTHGFLREIKKHSMHGITIDGFFHNNTFDTIYRTNNRKTNKQKHEIFHTMIIYYVNRRHNLVAS